MKHEEFYFSLDAEANGASRVGGNPPEIFPHGEDYLNKYNYFLTISSEHMPALGGKHLSIFLRRDFSNVDEDTAYPNIGVDCILHDPSELSTNNHGRLDSLAEGGLVFHRERRDTYFIKVGGLPDFIQNEPYYEKRITEDGYSFLLQVDENGYPDDFIKDDYPFGYGGLYVYAKFSSDGKIIEAAPGFIQF